jgi:preprotein translocase subunit SecF
MIEFMRFRYYAYGVSLLLLGLSVFLLFWKGLNLGLDFTGGTLLEVRFEKKVSLGEVRKAMEMRDCAHFRCKILPREP